MAFLDWSPELSVGVTVIDSEHHELVNMLNDLHSALSSGKGKQVLKDILDRLVRYTESHFAHEEELMRRYAYPEAWKHTNEHRELTKQVLAEQKRFDDGKVIGLPIEVMDFLRNWLAHHIQTVDARFGAFLITKGLK